MKIKIFFTIVILLLFLGVTLEYNFKFVSTTFLIVKGRVVNYQIEKVKDVTASDISQCKIVDFGGYVCNQTRGWLVYSIQNTQEEKLLKLVAEYNSISTKLINSYMLSTNCDKQTTKLVVAKTPVIVEGQCVIK
ncbi:MAG: hypothetical protein NTW35_01025 [Candidatus Nomurabacteria bacterium]|nr:hypothetical protein [Candidatus Nomurabacteria bacterium]